MPNGSLKANLVGKRIICHLRDAGPTMIFQFEKDGTLNGARLKEGKLIPEKDALAYEVKGLRVQVSGKGALGGGFHFPSSNPMAGDRFLVGKEAREVVATILRTGPAAPLTEDSVINLELPEVKPNVSKVTRQDGAELGFMEMISVWKQPLSDKEKLMVGRWRETNSENPKNLGFSIMRKDRSFTFFSISSQVDPNGIQIPGKFERSTYHGLWRLQGGRIHYLDLLIDGKKCDYDDVYKQDLVALSPEFFLIRSKSDENGRRVQVKGESLEEFAVPEMRPYNAPDALQGFDLGWAYLTAEGASYPPIEDSPSVDGDSSSPDGEVPVVEQVPDEEVAMDVQEGVARGFSNLLHRQMLATRKQPLSEKEKLMVGRWKEIKSTDSAILGYSIMRADRSSTCCSVFPLLDSDGIAIPGKFEKIIYHGLWRIDGNRLYFHDFVSEGAKSDMILLSELALSSPKGFSYRVMNDGPNSFAFSAVPLEKFSVPEMLPYNSPDALTGFDLRATYRKAKGKGARLINKFLGLGHGPSPKDTSVASNPIPLITLRDVNSGNLAEIKRKLEQGADPNVIFSSKATALHRACNLGQANIVRLLLARGANPNALNAWKMTALDVLMSPDQKGSPPLDRMSAERQTTIRALLEKAGGKRSLRDPSAQD